MMANPRRSWCSSTSSSGNHQNSISVSINSAQTEITTTTKTVLSSLKVFLKKPHAFPFLLSIFLFLTWVFLRLQQHSSKSLLASTYSFSSSSPKWSTDVKAIEHEDDDDLKANLVRFPSSGYPPSPITKDKRGWLLDPLAVALDTGISGGALICASLHVGEIRPGGLRGNHRHHTCNETFLIWGSKMVFRLENNAISKGYAEVTIAAEEVAVAASPSGTAHALINVDPARTTYFLGCQDNIINYNSSTSDFNVWKDL